MSDTTPSQADKAEIAAFLMNYGIKPVPGALVDELAKRARANADARLVEALRGVELSEDGLSLRTPYDGDVDGDGRHIVVGGEVVVTFSDCTLGETIREALLEFLPPTARAALSEVSQ